jgi:charged multivesicular body protein 5
VKLAKVNAELSTYQQKLSKMRDGPGKNAIKQKALKVLQQRKLYENQKAQLQQQSWNMEQAGMMQDNLKNVMTTVWGDSCFFTTGSDISLRLTP